MLEALAGTALNGSYGSIPAFKHQRSGGTKSLLSPRTPPEPMLAPFARQLGELRVTLVVKT